MENRNIYINKVYQHFKGNKYLVVDIAKHCDSLEDFVVYRALYGDGKLWIRPLNDFLSEVDHQKYPNVLQKYRFEEVLNL
ncbi:MAG: DUF1653 domain-containing protein [Bacteroidales bacterium]|nr:DUF1653 domain-containing protein [Bacteroidales bacterium]